MEAVLESIKDWFLDRSDYFNAFIDADSRLEGWFKAELLLLLPKLVGKGLLERFERECNISTPTGRKQIDFCLSIQGGTHYCELKAMCISQAAGTPRSLKFYFQDNHVGLIRDFKKVDGIPGNNKWVLGFVYPNPGVTKWEYVIESVPDIYKHWQCETSPKDFPEYLFICLWKSRRS